MSITVSGPQPRNGLAGDSIAIVLTYFLTAAAGMLFWIVAARTIPAHELGVQTALISLITAIGTVTAYGVGSAYKAMLSAPGCVRRKRLVDGLIITVVVSLAVGTLAGQFAGEAVGGDSISALLVPAGALVLALFVLKDAALIGLHATRWLPVLNLVSVLVKVGLVVLLAGWLDLPAVWATVVPAAATALFAFAFLIPALVRDPDGVSPQDLPDPRLSRRAMGAFVFRDGVASSTSFGLILVLPFITTWLAGPVAGATLAIAMAVAQALDFVPDGAGAALTSHMAREPAAATFHVRRIWLISTVLVGTGAVVLAIGSPWVGRLFGEGYNDAEFPCLPDHGRSGFGSARAVFDLDGGVASVTGDPHNLAGQHGGVRRLVADHRLPDPLLGRHRRRNRPRCRLGRARRVWGVGPKATLARRARRRLPTC